MLPENLQVNFSFSTYTMLQASVQQDETVKQETGGREAARTRNTQPHRTKRRANDEEERDCREDGTQRSLALEGQKLQEGDVSDPVPTITSPPPLAEAL